MDRKDLGNISQRIMQVENYLELITKECHRLREELGRFYAPAQFKMRRSKHQSSIAAVLNKRNLTLSRNRNCTKM